MANHLRTSAPALRRCPRLNLVHRTVRRYPDQPWRVVYVKRRAPNALTPSGVELVTRSQPLDTSTPSGRRAARRSGASLSRLLRGLQTEVQRALLRANSSAAPPRWSALRTLICLAPSTPLTVSQIEGPVAALRDFVRSLNSAVRADPAPAPVEQVHAQEAAEDALDLQPLIAHMDAHLRRPEPALSLLKFSAELVDRYVEEKHMAAFAAARDALEPRLRKLTLSEGLETWPPYVAGFPHLRKLYLPNPAGLDAPLDELPAQLKIKVIGIQQEGGEIRLTGLGSRSVRIGRGAAERH